MSVVSQADAKEIGDKGVDGCGLPEGPGNSGSVVAARVGGPPGRLRLFQHQGFQIKIGVCDSYLRIVEADEVGCDVLSTLNLSDPDDPVFVGVNPYSPRLDA